MAIELLAIGTQTPQGKVGAVQWTGGERHYQLVDSHGGVTLQPAFMTEAGPENCGACGVRPSIGKVDGELLCKECIGSTCGCCGNSPRQCPFGGN